MQLPSPALCRLSAELPRGERWTYEVKWDGVRALVGRLEGCFVVRSRRGWTMTGFLPELEALPDGVVLDGEIVAFDEARRPCFATVLQRVPGGDLGVPVSFVAFDLLAVDGEWLLERPLEERLDRLAALDLPLPSVQLNERFGDGAALWQSACSFNLEGVIAKRLDSRYRPGRRDWIKVKNPAYRRPHGPLPQGRWRRSAGVR